ncbi:MAG: deoxyribodipyrimidine photo-lyase [Bacteroidota bacterium]
MGKERVNIVWFKRDLRLQDHAPLSMAIAEQLPILLIYCFEPSLLAAPQHSTRHWRFVYESLLDMQRQLTLIGVKLHIFHAEVEEVLERLTQVPWNGDSAKPHQTSQIHQLFCHQETGHKLSFDRDKRVKALCERKGITYQEFVQDGVIRGRKHRRGFKEHADAFLAEPLIKVPINKLAKLSIALPPSAHNVLVEQAVPPAITSKDKNFQPGGETAAWRYLHSFTTERAYRYSYQLSSPSKHESSRILGDGTKKAFCVNSRNYHTLRKTQKAFFVPSPKIRDDSCFLLYGPLCLHPLLTELRQILCW